MPAASELNEETPINISATIYGWGNQNTSAPDIPVKQLKGLNVTIVSCEPYFNINSVLASVSRNYPGGVNKYICISKPEGVGGTCGGDSGGGLSD